MVTKEELIEFVVAIAAAFPVDAPRDRYGRYCGVRDTDKLRAIAQKVKLSHGMQDTQEQAGAVALKLLEKL